MNIFFRCFVTVFCALFSVCSHAGYSGIWGDDCKQGKDGFILGRNHDSGPYQLMVCAGFTCIRMPGMQKPVNITRNPLFKLVSEQEIQFKGKTYFKCNEAKEVHFEKVEPNDIKKYLKGSWVKVAKLSGDNETPITDSRYSKGITIKITDESMSSYNDEKLMGSRKFQLIDNVIVFPIDRSKVSPNFWDIKDRLVILSISDKRMYISELTRPNEPIVIFERR